MRSIARGFATAVLAAGAAAGTAQGVTIQAHVEGSVSSTFHADTQGPAGSGSVLASQSWGPGQGFVDPVLSARALAAQNDAGVSAVWVEAVPDTPNGDSQQAESRWSDSVVHPGPPAAEYVYEFHVNSTRLALKDTSEGGPGNDAASYSMEVRLNGVLIFQSAATLSGPASNPQLATSGTPFTASFFDQPSAHTYGYDFDAYDGMISLGVFLPGQTISVETILRVDDEIETSGVGAFAAIGDPLDLGGDPGISNGFFIVSFVGTESQAWSGIKALYR
jgi:hypothetical protein